MATAERRRAVAGTRRPVVGEAVGERRRVPDFLHHLDGMESLVYMGALKSFASAGTRCAGRDWVEPLVGVDSRRARSGFTLPVGTGPV